MKAISTLFFLFVFWSILPASAQNTILTGLVIDKTSKEPLPFVNIKLKGIALGTVTEGDGQYRITIPKPHENGILVFSYLGYESRELGIQKLKVNSKDPISLKKEATTLTEILVKPKKLPSARSILKKVIKNIPNNYPTTPLILTGYYRETLKENGVYIKFTDAACQYYNAPYPTKKLKWKDYTNTWETGEPPSVDLGVLQGPPYIEFISITKP